MVAGTEALIKAISSIPIQVWQPSMSNLLDTLAPQQLSLVCIAHRPIVDEGGLQLNWWVHRTLSQRVCSNLWRCDR